jgi:DNA-binding NarL/FixJ family response regulator
MAAPDKIRVFLVDDVTELRLLVRLTLEEDPEIEVVGEASDGHAGVEGVAETQPDVVLLDLSMPELDGMEAIPAMRELSPRTRIVALSGFGADRMAEPVLARGAHAYLEKGEEIAAIRAAVHDAARAA